MKRNNLKRAGAYLFVLGSSLGLPLVAELSGGSEKFGKRIYELQRRDYVYLANKSTSEKEKSDFQRNINYLDENKNLIQDSARVGADVGLFLLGFAGSTGAIVAKRKLDEFLK